MVECYVGIGSNIGNRKENIAKAIELIKVEEKIISTSSLIKTNPMYYLNQEEFLNGVVLIKTEKSPKELLIFFQQIENKMKRERVIKYGPRIIDLDILFYDSQIINELNLIIPHPLIQEREFVLKPLVELNSNLIHPKLNKSIQCLLEELKNRR